MQPDLDSLVDKVLAGYAQVEPAPEAVQAWMARARMPLPRRRYFWLPAPAWAAIMAALALILGFAWFRAHRHPYRQPHLAQEHVVLVPVNPKQAPPLTDEQKRLIQLLETNPAALGKIQPTPPPKPKKGKQP